MTLACFLTKALGETTDGERQVGAEVVAAMTTWPGIGASVANRTLHKKRPALVPVLDNMAIFGAYMYSLWPEKRARAGTIKAVPRIKQALDWIAEDLAMRYVKGRDLNALLNDTGPLS